MNSNYYYDYANDFPQGNGWSWNGSTVSFRGVVIDSTSYIFKRGKYQGKTLQQLMSRSWKGVLKYIDYGFIYINNSVLDSLNAKPEVIFALRTAGEAKMQFRTITSINDNIYSSPFASVHQGRKFIDVAKLDPKFLIRLINRAYRNYHGENQSYYASDFGITLRNPQHILDELKEANVAPNLVTFLKDLIEEQEEREEYERMEREDYYDRQMMNDLIREGYREAYNDDPDAIWNTD